MRGLTLWRHQGQTINYTLFDIMLEGTLQLKNFWFAIHFPLIATLCSSGIPLSSIPWGPIGTARFVGFWQPNFCLKSQNMCGFTQGTFSTTIRRWILLNLLQITWKTVNNNLFSNGLASYQLPSRYHWPLSGPAAATMGEHSPPAQQKTSGTPWLRHCFGLCCDAASKLGQPAPLQSLLTPASASVIASTRTSLW